MFNIIIIPSNLKRCFSKSETILCLIKQGSHMQLENQLRVLGSRLCCRTGLQGSNFSFTTWYNSQKRLLLIKQCQLFLKYDKSNNHESTQQLKPYYAFKHVPGSLSVTSNSYNHATQGLYIILISYVSK